MVDLVEFEGDGSVGRGGERRCQPMPHRRERRVRSGVGGHLQPHAPHAAPSIRRRWPTHDARTDGHPNSAAA